jgi:Protein of unknown function (DUF2934)
MPKTKFPKKTNGVEQVNANATPAPKNDINLDPQIVAKPAEGATTPASAAKPWEAETKTAATNKVRKPEIVKSETRKNLVPINLEDEIRRLAYLLSERRGFQAGHETEDWLAAEHEVLERYHQHTA